MNRVPAAKKSEVIPNGCIVQLINPIPETVLSFASTPGDGYFGWIAISLAKSDRSHKRDVQAKRKLVVWK